MQTRAEIETAIAEFSPTRIADAMARLHRMRGLSALHDEAADLLLDILETDQALHDRMAARNRAIAAGRVAAE